MQNQSIENMDLINEIHIKEEVYDNIEFTRDEADPLDFKIEKEVISEAKIEFVHLDSIDPISANEEESNIQTQKLVENFENVVVKEEIDFTSLYCEMCNIKFSENAQFEEHCIFHNKRSTFFCSVCLEVFKSKKGISRHLSKHREIVFFCKCNLCNYTFATKEDLAMHTKTFKHIKHFSCDECGKKFFLKSNLTIHKRLHTDEIFSCEICEMKFARLLFLQNHMISHKNGNKSKKEKGYVCNRCEFTTKDKIEFSNHKSNHDPIYKCRKCDFTAGSYASVRRHKKDHLTDVIFKCELCPYQSNQKYRLDQHKTTHFDVKPFECHICKVRLCTKNSLNRHLKSHTEGNFECELCKKSFNLLKYLKDHMKRHVNKELFECEMCDFKSYQKYYLDKHQVEANHKKMHKCEVCGKEFTTKHSYKLHVSVHVGKEKFDCIFCEQKFVLSRQLLQHIKLNHPGGAPLKCDTCKFSSFITSTFEKHKIRHKEVKPYVCGICKVGFNYNQSLKKHMTMHLGLTPYECKVCDKKYSKHDTLKQHMLSHSRKNSDK